MSSSDDYASSAKRRRRIIPRPDYKSSEWAMMLNAADVGDHTSTSNRVFRMTFRVPHAFFLQLVSIVKERRWFTSVGKDIGGRQCIPVELKVLAVLHVLGGNTFEHASKLSLISEPTLCASFHTFCKHIAQNFYPEHVCLPTGAAQERAMGGYHRLGLTGAVGATGIARFRWAGCPVFLAGRYTAKEGSPSIAYQATVDHFGHVLAITHGFPGGANDREMARCDLAIQRLREDVLYRDRLFQVRGEDGELREHRGNYLLVDSGHYQWGSLMGPCQNPVSEQERQWSTAVDLARKDADRFFAALTGRFRMLKLPIASRKKELVDNIVLTCCTLHNMLRGLENLDVLEAGVEWGGRDGLHFPWVNDPSINESSVGWKGTLRDDEAVEPAHHDAKNKLIADFAYRLKRGEIVTLNRE